MILTPAQWKALRALADHTEPVSAYDARLRLDRLRELERLGLAAGDQRPGEILWPNTRIFWCITDKGKAVL